MQKVCFSVEGGKPFSFWIKRDDLIDPVISGNKWRKLKFNIEKAIRGGNTGILTFGGAYSNHLVATAKAAQTFGLKAVGIVRGDELHAESNETLISCKNFGMELRFVSRNSYADKCSPFFLDELRSEYPNYHVVPEGGSNFYGAAGCQEIMSETPNDFDCVYLAGGTGTTAAGVLSSTPEKTMVHVISALKGDFLNGEITSLLHALTYDETIVSEMAERMRIVSDDRFGGYGKANEDLIAFINDFYGQTAVPLDPVYTGKAAFSLINDFRAGKIDSASEVLLIHTGGLQGVSKWKEELQFCQT